MASEARWLAWQERGLEHDRTGRQRLAILIAAIVGAALAYALLF
jgi:hypothetical protein